MNARHLSHWWRENLKQQCDSTDGSWEYHGWNMRVTLQWPTPLRRPHQQKTVSFSYSFYYTMGTNVVASILGGSRKKNLGKRASTRQHFTTCWLASQRNLGPESVSTLQNSYDPLTFLLFFKNPHRLGILTNRSPFWPILLILLHRYSK